jgi:hypothetical protein
VNPAKLSPGNQVTLADGSLAEVVSVPSDRQSVRIRYVDTLDNPELNIGDEQNVAPEEVIALFMGGHAEGAT